MALVYLPSLIMVSLYFHKRRSLATALACAGSQFGAFIHPILDQFLLEYYDLDGSLLIIGALMLNSFAISFLLRPVEYITYYTEAEPVKDIEAETGPSLNIFPPVNTVYYPPVLQMPLAKVMFERQLSERIHSNTKSDGSDRRSSISSLDKEKSSSLGAFAIPGTPDGGKKSLLLHRERRNMLKHPSLNSSILSIPIFDPSLAPDSLFPGSQHELSRPVALQEKADSHVDKKLAIVSENQIPLSFSSIPEAPVKCEKSRVIDKVCSSELIGNLAPFVRHFKSIQFSSFVVSNFLLCLAFYTPSVFIANWGQEIGIPETKTTVLMALIGLGNIIGRPFVALSADHWTQFRIPLYALMVGLSGIVTTITPLLPNFYFLAFFVFQFGLFAGTSQSLLTPILADMVPLSELSHAFGVLILADGIAILIGPPMLALLPSYDLTFAVSGLIMISSSLVLVWPFWLPYNSPSTKNPRN